VVNELFKVRHKIHVSTVNFKQAYIANEAVFGFVAFLVVEFTAFPKKLFTCDEKNNKHVKFIMKSHRIKLFCDSFPATKKSDFMTDRGGYRPCESCDFATSNCLYIKFEKKHL